MSGSTLKAHKMEVFPALLSGAESSAPYPCSYPAYKDEKSLSKCDLIPVKLLAFT